MSCDLSYWADRLTAAQTALAAFEAAELAFATNGAIEEYEIDTGQTRTKVHRSDLGEIRRTIASLYNRVATLEARVSGCGTTRVRPAW